MYDPYGTSEHRGPWPRVALGLLVVLLVTVTFLLLFEVFGFIAPSHFARPAPGYPFGIFPVLLVVLLVIWFARMAFWGYPRRYSRRFEGQDPALTTVRQRFARGEISQEQYQQLMTELTRRRTGP